jgi:hypothetical protein
MNPDHLRMEQEILLENNGLGLFLEYAPGNCTKYPLLFIPLPMRINNSSGVLVVLMWARFRSAVFPTPPDPSYVVKKFDVGEADAHPIADAIKYGLAHFDVY